MALLGPDASCLHLQCFELAIRACKKLVLYALLNLWLGTYQRVMRSSPALQTLLAWQDCQHLRSNDQSSSQRSTQAALTAR